MENLIRKCPSCSKTKKYKSLNNYNIAERNNAECASCCRKGNKNPFFGKKHSKETINLIQSKIDRSVYKTPEFKEKMSKLNSGEKNPMYGKTVYGVWLDKYGKDIADEKMAIFIKKTSDASSGENNPMYGKPSPKGSGNGWSGWYKDHFFRSLRELIFIVKIIERYDFKWSTGETKNIKIQYEDFNGQIRNYFPDFILNDKYMIEIKPKSLWKSYTVVKKKQKADEYCQQNNLIYKLFDINVSNNFKLINELYENKQIEFTDKTEDRYKKWLQTRKS